MPEVILPASNSIVARVKESHLVTLQSLPILSNNNCSLALLLAIIKGSATVPELPSIVVPLGVLKS